MCQTIPSCYEKGRKSILIDLCEDVRKFLSDNPEASDEDIKNFIDKLCLKKHFETKNLLDYFKEDLERGKKLINDPKESKAVHKIQEMYCKDYERILSAFGLF